MSVLACNRAGCTNVMCDRLILNRAKYICDECWEELQLIKEKWPEEMEAGQVEPAIRRFMATDKSADDYVKATTLTVDEEFKCLTGG